MSLQKYFFPFLEDEENFSFPRLANFMSNQNLSVFEDDKSVVVEAPLPGLNNEEVDVTFQKGVLQIRGSKKTQEEDKKRRYLRKRNETYLYQLTVPGPIDEQAEPQAVLKNGIMRVEFQKQKKEEPKRIPIKNS